MSDTDSCCPDGSWPGVVEDKDREVSGEVGDLDGGLKYYYSAPPSDSTKGILSIYDVHGFSGGRVKSVCDAMASAGFHVIMVDVYGDEKGVNDLGGFGAEDATAMLKENNWAKLEPELDLAIAFLKDKGVTTIGSVGYCWGGWVVAHLATTGKIQAGASCHPSIRVGPMIYDETEEEICSAIQCPIILCPAGNDPPNVKEGGELVQLIAANHACKSVEFPDMQHGWVIRGDTSDAAVARDVTAAVNEVTAFFDEHL